MSQPQNNKNLSALDGTATPVVKEPAAATGLVTLTATDDYYFIIPRSAEYSLESIHILCGAAIAGTFTIETCNFPKETDAQNIATVADNDETTGNWVKEDPSTAYVATVGSGWSVTNLTLTKTAAAGAAMIHLGNMGARRMRLKFNCTTGGTVRVVAHGKAL